MCMVSVIMPVYNSKKYLHEAVESVIAQTFQDWELLAVNEYGSDDGSAEILREYEKKDQRIRFIQNSTRLGLAESLNLGFREARGTYLARLDADDLALPERFAKQVQYMEENPNVGICGTYQHHFGDSIDWVHQPPISPAQCRAGLLFGCDLCHSTLMLRKKTVEEHQLYYNDSYLAEDYELWTRALYVTDIANIPEVLGKYRIGECNITNEKKEKLNIESGYIVAKNLKKSLGFVLPESQVWFFQGWENPFWKYDEKERKKYYHEFEIVLRKVIKANQKKGFYEEKELLRVIDAKWRWAKYGTTWNEKRNVSNMNEIFHQHRKHRMKYLIKKVFRKPYYAVKYRTVDVILKQLWQIEGKTGRDLAKISSDIHMLKNRLSDIDDKINRMEQSIYQYKQEVSGSFYESICKETKNLHHDMDERIWNAEQNLSRMLDERIWNAECNVKQSMDGRIWKAECSIIKMQEVLAELFLQFRSNKNKLVMINTPIHDNLGDHAIAFAEKCWVEEHTSYQYIEITGDMYRRFGKVIKKFISPKDLIGISGGGYMGSLWEHEQELVESVVANFSENRIRIFPQTVFFEGHEKDEKLEKVKTCLRNHPDLILYVRERNSYGFMKKHMPACKCELVADMAFYLHEDYKTNRIADKHSRKAALCLKGDCESVLTQDKKDWLKQLFEKADFDVCMTDMLLEQNLEDTAMRYQYIKSKITEFKQYQVLVTDRFHGAAFALLAGINCYVLPGKSFKNQGLCEMLGNLSGVRYVAQMEEMEHLIFQKDGFGKTDRKQVLEGLRAQYDKILQSL